jgi:hypothetical protein
MKYTISINQKQAIELGLTNINQLFIFDLLISAQSWAKTIIIEGDTHYWVARQAIADQLPILNLKPDTVYRHLKELTKLGLIDYAKHGNMDCINITDKGKSYSFGSKSDNSEVSNEQLGSKPQDKAEADPTYKTTTSISLLDNKTNEDGLTFEDFWSKYPNKKNKAQAVKAFNKLSSDDQQLAIDGIHGYLDTVTQDKFICHASTYLNNARWEDQENTEAVDDYSWADGSRVSDHTNVIEGEVLDVRS